MGDLPQAAIDVLPLSAEPMSQWKKEVDIRLFAKALYPAPFHPPPTRELNADLEKEMREQARVFTKNLMEAQNASTYIDFYQDHRFGQVAKYALALKCCIQSLLEDAGFYSLAHVLEADSDLECSLLLASHFYYKQATLMLRNILEEIFLPIHFCDSVVDFNAWKADSYRTPNLRGKDGLIKRLLKKNIIHEPLATRVSNLYRDLSSYVHGSQSTLIHQNVHLGEVHRVEFEESVFSAWCQLFCECVDVCARLLIPIRVLRDHSKMGEVGQRTETLRVGFQLVESITHLVNHLIKRGKSQIRKLFFAQLFPDMFHRIELGTVSRLSNESNIVWDPEIFGPMPARLIHLHHHKVLGIGARHMLKKQIHHLGIGRRKDE